MKKINLAVLFGGQSSEHEVSCMSAVNIIDQIDKERYELLLIGITKEGRWLRAESAEEIRSGEWCSSREQAVILPDAVRKSALVSGNGESREFPLDVVFPVLHGLYGEDGTVQGLLELAGIPYVGCGVLASAVSMDKLYTKIVVDKLGIRQARYVGTHRRDLDKMQQIIAEVEFKLGYPVIVKPSCAGSSVGVSKAENREQLERGIRLAAAEDEKILIEEMICGRELECAVLGEEKISASGVGEVLSAAEFYDYEAKYNNPESRTDVSPQLPEGREEEIRQDAMKIFQAVGGSGLARIDFFLDKDGVVFNELNTMPGFTAISMYPMLWESRGLAKKELIERLIRTAFHRGE